MDWRTTEASAPEKGSQNLPRRTLIEKGLPAALVAPAENWATLPEPSAIRKLDRCQKIGKFKNFRILTHDSAALRRGVRPQVKFRILQRDCSMGHSHRKQKNSSENADNF